MFDYVWETTEAFEKAVGAPVGKKKPKTLAADHLFTVNPNARPLTPNEGAIFHTFVAKLLFLSKCERLDIATVVAFLTIQVTKFYENDWKKLQCVM